VKIIVEQVTVTEFIAQKRKNHRVGGNLIMPANKFIVGKILKQDAVREIENVSPSNSMINRITDDMSHELKRFCMIN
jgi:hypothetical protein